MYDFVKNIYNIFNEESDPEKRFKLIQNMYEKNHPINENKNKAKWECSIPLVKSIVQLGIKENVLFDYSVTSGTNTLYVCSHLGKKLNHNKELMLLLLELAQNWNEDIYVSYKLKYENYVDLNQLKEFVEDNIDNFYRYDGNLAIDIANACRYDVQNVKSELINNYYHFLALDCLGTSENISNSGWGKKLSVSKVIVW